MVTNCLSVSSQCSQYFIILSLDLYHTQRWLHIDMTRANRLSVYTRTRITNNNGKKDMSSLQSGQPAEAILYALAVSLTRHCRWRRTIYNVIYIALRWEEGRRGETRGRRDGYKKILPQDIVCSVLAFLQIARAMLEQTRELKMLCF